MIPTPILHATSSTEKANGEKTDASATRPSNFDIEHAQLSLLKAESELKENIGLEIGFIPLICPTTDHCDNCLYPTTHQNTMIVGVAGGSLFDFHQMREVAFRAAYFGSRGMASDFTEAHEVDGHHPSFTDYLAAEFALWLALDKVREGHEYARGLEQVVIASYSAELVDGMTKFIFEWDKLAPPIDSRRIAKPVEYGYLREIESLIVQLNERGVETLFWLVPWEQNKGANDLIKLLREDYEGLRY
ncbi:hypothetical protein K402DRAFT_408919 [Aulographum hederae CBS 113979]|uniref:RNase H type-1 domain-containing protein n=1 Tax=Aulographum hederae CBS 113979 TaxID=1176131 RepID=A0A6G1GJ85_9PEZI|nr:hypothetical protein K402DRAFT_408919 [Aulographum hederae CBS 113979]